MLYVKQFSVPDKKPWFLYLLSWLDGHFPYIACFQNNGEAYPYGTFPEKIYAGFQAFSLETALQVKGKESLIGIVSYEFKNQVESLFSRNAPIIECPETIFFIPELTIHFDGHYVEVESSIEMDLDTVFQPFSYQNPPIKIQSLTNKEKYFQDIEKIKSHIKEGDIYEMNYCMGFSFQEPHWNPLLGYYEMRAISPMPFSGLMKADHLYLLMASPERFLKKVGRQLIAQPIKGTMRRGVDEEEDQLMSQTLLHSEKERAENLMIVDLMRNDLSKVSEIGSVKVEELFGVYTFPKVHQMISTVSSTVKEDVSFYEIMKAAFPMGSMTGAPKIKCMELIERYENFKRGWFSGAFGRIDEKGDFDFNVVIRSIIFDRDQGKGYFAVGSAITYDADAAQEYEECLLKASAIFKVLSSNH